ncbi:hypothetical protein ABQE69_15935 [Mycolicibacillus trivialis]
MSATRAGLVVAAGLLALTGCSGPVSDGGDTTCRTFLTQDDHDQAAAITTMLDERGAADATDVQISAAHDAVSGYCRTLGHEDSAIRQAPQL